MLNKHMLLAVGVMVSEKSFEGSLAIYKQMTPLGAASNVPEALLIGFI